MCNTQKCLIFYKNRQLCVKKAKQLMPTSVERWFQCEIKLMTQKKI